MKKWEHQGCGNLHVMLSCAQRERKMTAAPQTHGRAPCDGGWEVSSIAESGWTNGRQILAFNGTVSWDGDWRFSFPPYL